MFLCRASTASLVAASIVISLQRHAPPPNRSAGSESRETSDIADGRCFRSAAAGYASSPTDQFTDAAADEEKCGWVVDDLRAEDFPGQGQGIELAAGTGRPDLSCHAPVLAEDGSPVCIAAGRRHVATTGDRADDLGRALTTHAGGETPPEARAVIAIGAYITLDMSPDALTAIS